MISEEDLFRPKGRLVITDADIARRAALDSADQLDLSNTDQTHPFDRSDFVDFIRREFPELIDQIAKSTRPTRSNLPDELEEWESTRILSRKNRFPNEENWAYLERFLYEEFFSVNQAPQKNTPPMKSGTPGLTVGGLISHFYDETEWDDFSLERILQIPFFGRTMSEAIQSLKRSGEIPFIELRRFVDRVQTLSVRSDAGLLATRRVLRPGPTTDQVYMGSDSYQALYPQLDSVGYRLLALLKSIPEFMESVEDEELKELTGLSESTKITRAAFFVKVWQYSQKLFKADTNKKELLAILLRIRVHPEMQIFFKYFSPSGYVNDWISQSSS